jgi:hypothetical protein
MRVLQDSQLAERLVSNARQELQRYCWPVVREQWLKAYRALASTGTKQGAGIGLRGHEVTDVAP